MSAGSTQCNIILNNTTILHMKTFFTPDCRPRKKISSDTKLSHSSLLHTCAFHASSSTSIDPIKTDHFLLGRNTDKSIQLKQVDSNTNQIRNISLLILQGQAWGWGQGQGQDPIIHYPIVGIYHSTQLHDLILIFIYTYFVSIITQPNMEKCQTVHIICKYSQPNKYGGLLGILFSIPKTIYL